MALSRLTEDNPRLRDCAVFFDFDNTITPFDVLDDIIRRFSVNNNWISLERRWKRGEIGSEECLKGQLGCIRVSKETLSRYLSRIKLRPYFRNLLHMLKHGGVKPVILSDDFSFIIKTILRSNGIKGIRVYSNRVRFNKDRLLPSFPHTNRSCRLCGHCKKKHLKISAVKDKMILYIGDGLSDVCPALHADFVFAKGDLLRHLRKAKKSNYAAYRNHREIYNCLKRLNNAAETKRK